MRSASTASRSSAAPIVCRRRGAVAGHHDDAGNAGLRAACRIARGVSARSSSASSSAPIGRPSTATNTISAERHEARRIARTRPFVRLPVGKHEVARAGADRHARDDSVQAAAERSPAHSPGSRAAARARPPPRRWRRPGHGARPVPATRRARSTSSTFSPARPRRTSAGHHRRSAFRSCRTARCARAPAPRAAPPPLTRMPRRAAWATPAMKATGAARISGHGVAATSTARLRIRSPDTSQASARDRQRHRQEHQRIAVGQPHERRLRGLRRSHQPHDAGIGALPGDRGRGHLECLAGIERAAAAAAPRALTTGIGSPVSADSSIIGGAAVTMPSTGMISPGAHQQPVADGDLADRQCPRCVRRVRRCASRGARSTSARRSRSARATANPRAHCRRNTSMRPRRRRAARRARARPPSTPARWHRRRAARQEVAHDRDGKAGDHRRRGKGPAQIGKPGISGRECDDPRGQAAEGDADQGPSQDAFKRHCRVPCRLRVCPVLAEIPAGTLEQYQRYARYAPRRQRARSGPAGKAQGRRRGGARLAHRIGPAGARGTPAASRTAPRISFAKHKSARR